MSLVKGVKRIAVLSSGSDNSGINSAIRAVVRSAKVAGISTFGVNWGYQGLVTAEFIPLTSRNVSGKIGKAGCFLGTGRPEDTLLDKEMPKILKNLGDRQIDGLVVVGGARSLELSKKLGQAGIKVVGIPSTVQDDVAGTDICLGVDSAVNNVVRAIDNIRSCDSSRQRTFLVEVEGRTRGFLAVRAAVVTGCEVLLTPEMVKVDLPKIAEKIAQHSRSGKTQVLTLVSSGWRPGIDALGNYLADKEKETDLAVRKTVLGYVQRGGAPTAFERLLGTQFGAKAIDVLVAGGSERMVALRENQIVDVSYDESVLQEKPPLTKQLELFELTNS